jgi:predicted secreted protein
MKRNAATRAMARPGASLALLIGLAATPALAGDRALIDFIGYSQTGQYFAFAELGVQDGSGFPYANVFVLDVAADTFVGGAPFRVRIDAEDASVATARQQAMEAAQPILDQHGIAFPVDLWVVSGDGVEGLAETLDFGIPGFTGPKSVRDSRSVRLETFTAPSAEPCADYTDQPVMGLQLSQVDAEGETVVHRDKTIPASRGCPFHYSLFAVVAPANAQDIARAVAIVSVYSLGFEGEDRRFIAIPIGH